MRARSAGRVNWARWSRASAPTSSRSRMTYSPARQRESPASRRSSPWSVARSWPAARPPDRRVNGIRVVLPHAARRGVDRAGGLCLGARANAGRGGPRLYVGVDRRAPFQRLRPLPLATRARVLRGGPHHRPSTRNGSEPVAAASPGGSGRAACRARRGQRGSARRRHRPRRHPAGLAAGRPLSEIEELERRSWGMRVVHVAPDHDEALRAIEAPFMGYQRRMSILRSDATGGSVPGSFDRSLLRLREFREYLADGWALVGTPDEVRDDLQKFREATGYERALLVMALPGLDTGRALRSMRLFAE